MKISYNWLREYCPTNITASEIADLLTSCGLEVEDIEQTESIKGGLDGIVVGHVLTCEDHPNSDHLHLTTVDIGNESPLEIVCGAANVAKGQKVAIATLGSKIWTSETEYFEIKKTKLRGFPSNGMICSSKELGLNSDHEGILVLQPETAVGTPCREYFQVISDSVLEVSITANRSDAISHTGVARDLIAVLNARQQADLQLQLPTVEPLPKQANGIATNINIANEDECPRYSGISLVNVQVEDSPSWLRNHLSAVGIRPINNVVDITNYVLLETGQPLHAFDLDTISGGEIHVKHLPKGTSFTTLDGVQRTLTGQELMICDQRGGIAMAGILGGMHSAVSHKTTKVFLESAYFNPVSIRKTAKHHNLKTDASFRFERGCDPNQTVYALQRAVALLAKYAKAEVHTTLTDHYPKTISSAEVRFSLSRMNAMAGVEIPENIVQGILHDLGINITHRNADELTLLIPTNKVDVTRECDVVEEILRIYGYDNIPVSGVFRSCLSHAPKPNAELLQDIISDYLADNGFREIMNNSLTPISYYENNADFALDHTVRLVNPLSKELDAMRQSLLLGGLETISYNINRRHCDLQLFEFGNVYRKNSGVSSSDSVTKQYSEAKHLSILLTGSTPETWQTKQRDSTFFDLKSIAENIFRKLRLMPNHNFDVIPVRQHYFADGLAWKNRSNDTILLSIGQIASRTLKQFDIKQDVYYAEIHWDAILPLISEQPKSYSPLSKYPEVRRDLALVIDKTVTYAQMETLAWETEPKLLRHINLFDVYEGKHLGEDKKSYAISLYLQSAYHTLTDHQIDQTMQRIIASFEQKLGAQLRQ